MKILKTVKTFFKRKNNLINTNSSMMNTTNVEIDNKSDEEFSKYLEKEKLKLKLGYQYDSMLSSLDKESLIKLTEYELKLDKIRNEIQINKDKYNNDINHYRDLLTSNNSIISKNKLLLNDLTLDDIKDNSYLLNLYHENSILQKRNENIENNINSIEQNSKETSKSLINEEKNLIEEIIEYIENLQFNLIINNISLNSNIKHKINVLTKKLKI